MYINDRHFSESCKIRSQLRTKLREDGYSQPLSPHLISLYEQFHRFTTQVQERANVSQYSPAVSIIPPTSIRLSISPLSTDTSSREGLYPSQILREGFRDYYDNGKSYKSQVKRD